MIYPSLGFPTFPPTVHRRCNQPAASLYMWLHIIEFKFKVCTFACFHTASEPTQQTSLHWEQDGKYYEKRQKTDAKSALVFNVLSFLCKGCGEKPCKKNQKSVSIDCMHLKLWSLLNCVCSLRIHLAEMHMVHTSNTKNSYFLSQKYTVSK